MISFSNLKVSTTSLVSREDLQKIVLQYECNATAHLFLSVYKGADAIVENHPLALSGGLGSVSVMLPLQSESFDAIWQISDRAGNILIQAEAPWKQPREWTLYIMVSSHTDIGLHNFQYIQRHNTSQFIDSAAAGENSGHLYLLWGANVEKDLSHYKLYRSEQAGFEPSDATFVADVLPEEYVVGRYEDTELKEHAYYYYRVCAVNTDGVCGPMSEEFSACTREMLYDMQGDMQA